MPHIPPRFHVQIQPWIPVSIVWVVPGSVVSPHVQVQFQIHVVGSAGVVGAAGVGAPTVPLCGAELGFGVVVDASPDCGCASAPS